MSGFWRGVGLLAMAGQSSSPSAPSASDERSCTGAQTSRAANGCAAASANQSTCHCASSWMSGHKQQEQRQASPGTGQAIRSAAADGRPPGSSDENSDYRRQKARADAARRLCSPVPFRISHRVERSNQMTTLTRAFPPDPRKGRIVRSLSSVLCRLID
jgi:hypothetical protein